MLENITLPPPVPDSVQVLRLLRGYYLSFTPPSHTHPSLTYTYSQRASVLFKIFNTSLSVAYSTASFLYRGYVWWSLSLSLSLWFLMVRPYEACLRLNDKQMFSSVTFVHWYVCSGNFTDKSHCADPIKEMSPPVTAAPLQWATYTLAFWSSLCEEDNDQHKGAYGNSFCIWAVHVNWQSCVIDVLRHISPHMPRCVTQMDVVRVCGSVVYLRRLVSLAFLFPQ